MNILPRIHVMWLGAKLSKLERLTLASFCAQGHEVTLWAYDTISTVLPERVTLADAERILPRAKIRAKREADPQTGIGKGSVGGVFSDLFRYKVLFEHGGIWADMDVTALRPLDFAEDYAFRPHRLGMVGSIMKCPKGSMLMRDVYAATEAIANEDTPWLLPIQILNQYVRMAGLEGYIVPEMSNLDSWAALQPFVEGHQAFPDKWYAVHWMNELWRTLSAQNGNLNGHQMTEHALDKDAPPLGSSLHELYRFYGLADIYEPFPPRSRKPAAVLTAESLTQTQAQRVDMLLPTLARGGAERVVVETLKALAPTTPCRLHVLGSAPAEYPLPAQRNFSVHRPSGSRVKKLRAIAFDLLAAGATQLYTHLIRAEDLEILWGFGVETIPVVHNARPGWLDAPTRYNEEHVPLVVACADSVAAQLRESGLVRPLTVLRHELQVRSSPATLNAERHAIRQRHGIRDDVVLVGMVGQFKLQKAYHRAVGVLAALKALGVNARLMVLGGWDHEWGSGRAAYEAFMRAAVEAGLAADIICPGVVDPAAPYYAAFDVYLNTSAYEGYSIAMLEALAAGCPVVAADVGGAREVLPANATLIAGAEDFAAYAEAIVEKLQSGTRNVPQAPLEPELVPRLWQMTGQAVALPAAAAAGVLILTQTLELGGPASSLVRLAAALPETRKLLVGVFGGVLEHHQKALDMAGAKLLGAANLPLATQAQCVLDWIERYRPRTLCFWNLRPELKLLLVKLLGPSRLRLLDVSPGPMLFDEMAGAEAFGRRIALTAEDYFARLDKFVTLYRGGEAPEPARNAVLPLGVPSAPAFVPLPAPHLLPRRGFDPALVVGTICRMVPDKQVEQLIGVAAKLRRRIPGATLMVVGGPDAASVPYFQTLLAAAEGEPAIRFTGPCDDPLPFLHLFRVFLLTGIRQGCPNASLEAMAMRLPVVAQPDGGIAEQVRHGVTGYLAEGEEAMARRVAQLLRDEALRARMGGVGYVHWRKYFSVDAMADRYDRVLFAS